MDLQKTYDGINREALWQVLKIYYVGGKILNGIKSIYVSNLVYVRVKGGESKCFRIVSGVKKDYIMPTWLLNLYMDTILKEVKMR